MHVEIEGQVESMDKMLSGLFGANDDDTPDTRTHRAGDFIDRVESGDPTEGYSTAEALQNYKHVASALPDDEYVAAARDALAKFSPQQRQEFGTLLSQKTGVTFESDIDSPQEIAQLTNQLRSSQANPASVLLGGGSELDDIIGALSDRLGGEEAGQATDVSQHDTAGIADLINNPVIQAVLAAIAAVAMKKYTGEGDGGMSEIFGGSGSETPGSTTPQNPIITNAPQQDDDHKSRGGGGLFDKLFGDDQLDGDHVEEEKKRGSILKREQKPKDL